MKFFTFNFNNHPLYKQVIDRNIKAGFDLTVITKPAAPHKYSNLSPVLLSDIERFWFLLNNPDWNYADADTIFLKEPNFEKEHNMPYLFGMNSCVIIGNGAQDFFELIYSTFNGKNYPTHYFSLLKTIYKDKFLFIPNGYFKHMSLGLLQRCPPDEGRTLSGNGYSVKKVKGELILRISE